MYSNPILYEINTRVWIKKFGERAILSDVPKSYFEKLSGKGISLVWLMGIWKTPKENITKYSFHPNLLKAYSNCLKDWKEEDVIGSPYAIDCYEINPDLGSFKELANFKKMLNSLGIKLILDFIPNHFATYSSVFKNNSHLFLSGNQELLKEEPTTFFKSEFNNKIYAHGKDPFFEAWTDTVQLNYFENDAKEFMTEQALNISKYCDGVRCDMSMLQLNDIFQNTWKSPLEKLGISKPENEFWDSAVKKIKAANPNFIMIAEVYWNLERELQNLGFDFTYDKSLLDMLKADDVKSIKTKLKKGLKYQKKLVRFLENHDEERALKLFGIKKTMAAAVLILTLPGMNLLYQGQMEGKKIKYSIQLGREPNENGVKKVQLFYDNLLNIVSDNVYKYGKFIQINSEPIYENDQSFNNILAWYWEFKNKKIITLINYSQNKSNFKINLELNNQNFVIKDKINITTDTSNFVDGRKQFRFDPYEFRILEMKLI